MTTSGENGTFDRFGRPLTSPLKDLILQVMEDEPEFRLSLLDDIRDLLRTSEASLAQTRLADYFPEIDPATLEPAITAT